MYSECTGVYSKCNAVFAVASATPHKSAYLNKVGMGIFQQIDVIKTQCGLLKSECCESISQALFMLHWIFWAFGDDLSWFNP